MKSIFSHHFRTYLAPLRTVRKSCAHISLHDGTLGVISAGILYTIQYAVGAIENNTPDLFWWRMAVVAGLVVIKVLIVTIRKPFVFHEFSYMHHAIFSAVLPRIIHSDHNQYEKVGTGKMISLFTSGTDKRLFMTIDIVGEGFKSVIFFSLFLIVLIKQGRWMLAGIAVILGLVVCWVSFFSGPQLRHRKLAKEAYTQMGRQSIKWLQARIEILQNNKIAYELNKIKNIMDTLRFHKAHEKRRQGISYDGAEFFLMLGFVGTMLWTGAQIIAGSMSFADMVLVVSMGTMAVAEIGKMSYRARSWIEQRVDISKLIDTLDDIAPHRDFDTGKNIVLTQSTISFENVRFGYDPEKPIITDFSLVIPGGNIIALVGPSGGGKSTLIKLIAGHLFPQGGKVFVDKQDREECNLLDRYNHIGYLTQEPSVFDGTVRENLLYGVVGAITDRPNNQSNETGEGYSSLHDVLEKSQCQFVYDLPSGLDTEIGERGVRLSGGQRQRLAIAKIMLKNPKIILLDEPTSALDSVSEELVGQAMQELFKDRTVVIIAHRLQTVKHADRILYIDKITYDDILPVVGRGDPLGGGVGSQIIESGTHDELIALGGKYAKMVEVQTGF